MWSWHLGNLPYTLFKALKCSCLEIPEPCCEAKGGRTGLKKYIYSRQKFLSINVEAKQRHRWQVFKAKARAALGEGGNQAHPPCLISEAFQAPACSLSVSRLPLKEPLWRLQAFLRLAENEQTEEKKSVRMTGPVCIFYRHFWSTKTILMSQQVGGFVWLLFLATLWGRSYLRTFPAVTSMENARFFWCWFCFLGKTESWLLEERRSIRSSQLRRVSGAELLILLPGWLLQARPCPSCPRARSVCPGPCSKVRRPPAFEHHCFTLQGKLKAGVGAQAEFGGSLNGTSPSISAQVHAAFVGVDRPKSINEDLLALTFPSSAALRRAETSPRSGVWWLLGGE